MMRARSIGLAFAALLVPCGLASAQKCTKTIEECFRDYWSNVEKWDGFNPQDSLYWSDKLTEVEWDLDSNAGCARVKAASSAAFVTNTWYLGLPTGQGYDGMHIPGAGGKKDGIILNEWYMLEDYDDSIKLELILHELGHAADFDHPEGQGHNWWPIHCGKMPEKKKEEEEPGEGGGDPEPVCEEKEVAEYYTVYEPKWQEVEVCVGFNAWGSEEIDSWCNTEWREVMVPVEKVRWVTQTVCESGDGP